MKPFSVNLSLVIPVFNEGQYLDDCLRETARCLEGLKATWEIVLVDDGSSDQSGHILQGYRSECVRVIVHQSRRGSGAARRTGFSAAKGEWIAWMDADCTYDPKDLLRLWPLREAGTQLIGARPRDPRQAGRLRLWGKEGFRHLAQAFWRTSIEDLNSGLRLLHRSDAEIWMSTLPHGFSCATCATLGALNAGQRLQFLPIAYRPRPDGSRSKFRPVIDSWRLFSQILVRRVKRRLRNPETVAFVQANPPTVPKKSTDRYEASVPAPKKIQAFLRPTSADDFR